ncbi:WD40-repeat-containing domain protein [Earliella scabrosa]|nr:WD40-repeat-containing domain protein [Earliella scabrosa]
MLDGIPESLSQRLPHLSRLHILYYGLLDPWTNPQKSHSFYLIGRRTLGSLKRYTGVHELSLSGVTFRKLADIVQLVTALPALTELRCCDIRYYEHGAGAGVRRLLDKSARLRTLYVHDVDEEIVQALVRTSQSTIKKLSLHAGEPSMTRFRADEHPILYSFLEMLEQLQSLELVVDVNGHPLDVLHFRFIHHLVKQLHSTKLHTVTLSPIGSVEDQFGLPSKLGVDLSTIHVLQAMEHELLTSHNLPHITLLVPEDYADAAIAWKHAMRDTFEKLDVHTEWTYREPFRRHSSFRTNEIKHTDPIKALAISPDSMWVASGSDDGCIVLWMANNSQSNGQMLFADKQTRVWDLAFSPDSQRLASVLRAGNSHIAIWDVSKLWKSVLASRQDIRYDVKMVSWSIDGSKLASCSNDDRVLIWDTTAPTHRQTVLLEGHTDSVSFVLFSPDGTMLASGGNDRSCLVWNVETGALRLTLHGHGDSIRTAAFDPGCQRIATSCKDGSVRIWSTSTGEELVRLHEHSEDVISVSFSRSGQWIMSASWDATIKVCDSFSGERALSLLEHDGPIYSAQFSPDLDNKFIASGSYDHTVRLWRMSDGSCVRIFKQHTNAVSYVLFTPDGKSLVSAGWDGRVIIRSRREWDPDMDQ